MMTKWKISAIYDGYIDNEILLPDGAEISSVSIRYGQMIVELVTGETIEVASSQYVDYDAKRPREVNWEKMS